MKPSLIREPRAGAHRSRAQAPSGSSLVGTQISSARGPITATTRRTPGGQRAQGAQLPPLQEVGSPPPRPPRGASSVGGSLAALVSGRAAHRQLSSPGVPDASWGCVRPEMPAS